MPSAKILAQKQAVVDELAAKIKEAKSGVIATYAGITVDKDTALRAALRKGGVEYKVYKNTISSRALEAAGYSALKEHMVGMTAIATCKDDEVAAAKILKEYADKVESFEIKAGFCDGDVLDQKGVLALAEIPSMDVLVCKVMMGMQSPLYKLAYALQAIIDKSGEAPAEAPAAE